MRIVVHGQEAFGKAVLEKLLERKENVVAVFCAPDKAGRAEDPLKVFAKEKGLPVHQPKSWKTPEALELMKSANADLCVMAYVTLFVPQPVLDAPKLGTIQYHPSLLPLHRRPPRSTGRSPWAAPRRGCRSSGPTRVWMKAQSCCRRRSRSVPMRLWAMCIFKKLFPLGVDAMMESVDLVRAGKAARVAQDHSKKTYESWFKKDVAEIDWARPAGEVYNLIRAANPAPAPGAPSKDTRSISSIRASCPVAASRRNPRPRRQWHDHRCRRRRRPGEDACAGPTARSGGREDQSVGIKAGDVFAKPAAQSSK